MIEPAIRQCNSASGRIDSAATQWSTDSLCIQQIGRDRLAGGLDTWLTWTGKAIHRCRKWKANAEASDELGGWTTDE